MAWSSLRPSREGYFIVRPGSRANAGDLFGSSSIDVGLIHVGHDILPVIGGLTIPQ
jgi:hypothetical protein